MISGSPSVLLTPGNRVCLGKIFEQSERVFNHGDSLGTGASINYLLFLHEMLSTVLKESQLFLAPGRNKRDRDGKFVLRLPISA